MSSPRSPQARRRVRYRIFIIIISVVAGSVAACFSWLLRDTNPWLSTMLANFAVVVLLLIPGEFALSQFRVEVDRIDGETAAVKETAKAALQTAETTARSLTDVQDKLVKRQEDELQADIDIHEGIVTDAGRESLIRALRRAEEQEIITLDGVRVPVWETSLHYRFVLGPDDELTVRIEQDNGDIVSNHPWNDDRTADDFYQELVDGVRAAGQDLGTGLNMPTKSVKDLSEMLAEVTRLRSQALRDFRGSFRRIIERREGWYFTERTIIVAENHHYNVDVDRLNEIDWDAHLHGKGWYTAPDALAFARRLYGIPIDPATPRYRGM